MYTIKNVSSKIIHIGTTVLMPDGAMKAPEFMANSPAVKALAKRKMLEITAPVVEAPKQEESAEKHDEQAAEGEVSSEDKAPEKPNARGTRRTTKPEGTEE